MRKTVGDAASLITVALLLTGCAAASQDDLLITASPASTTTAAITPTPTPTAGTQTRHKARQRHSRAVPAAPASSTARAARTAPQVSATAAPTRGAWCTANVLNYPDSLNGGESYDVYVSSDQPDTIVTASSGGYSRSSWTDRAGSAYVSLDVPQPGTTITVSVGDAIC